MVIYAKVDRVRQETTTTTYFSEDCETGSLTDQWTITTGVGVFSTDKAYTGSKSIKLTGGECFCRSDTFSPGTASDLVVWVYDSGNVNANYQIIVVPEKDSVFRNLTLGVRGASSTTHYTYRNGGAWVVSGIARTTGWRKFTLKWNGGTSWSYYVDDVLVANVTASASDWNMVRLYEASTASGEYFDDITVSVESIGDIAVTFDDYTKSLVTKRINKTNTSSTFTINYDNFDGIYSSTFAVGDEIEIYADKDTNPATTKIFTGMVKTLEYKGKPNHETLMLKGVDFGSGRLQEFLVEPTVFNNQEISTIVTSLMSSFTTGITVVNVNVTSTTLTYIQFKNISVWDAINQLAELAGFYFYVDEDKDLHFEVKEGTSSGFTFDSTNITNTATFKNKRDGMANDIFVYGGNKFTGRQETFIADGLGSVYQVQKRPHNSEVTVSGAIKKGAVFEMVNIPISGQEFLVDFDQRNIILTSGTEAGDNIPLNNVEVIVKYDASSPIIKRGQNESSIAQYGQITKVITDKNIDDPRIATDIVKNQLNLNSMPKIEGNITVENVVAITPGNTCIVDLPNQNISNQTYTILEAKYNFTPKKMFEDNVLTVRLNEKAKDILDTWKEIILDIKRLQVADINDSDVLTRLQNATGSFGFRVNTWTVNTFDVGSRFLLSHPVLGRLGTVTGTQPYLSGSFAQTYTFNQSGGEA